MDLGSNKIATLPASIGRLTALETLKLSENNSIATLPTTIVNNVINKRSIETIRHRPSLQVTAAESVSSPINAGTAVRMLLPRYSVVNAIIPQICEAHSRPLTFVSSRRSTSVVVGSAIVQSDRDPIFEGNSDFVGLITTGLSLMSILVRSAIFTPTWKTRTSGSPPAL